MNRTKRYPMIKGGLQLNFGEIGVELRMKERRIEEGIHENQFVRKRECLSANFLRATLLWWLACSRRSDSGGEQCSLSLIRTSLHYLNAWNRLRVCGGGLSGLCLLITFLTIQ